MTFIKSLSLLRPAGASKSFWPPGVASLVLLFWDPNDGSGTVVVYAVDPITQKVVFVVTIQAADQGALIQAVLGGGYRVVKVVTSRTNQTMTSVTIPGDRRSPDLDVIVISDPGPKDTGPRAISIALAVTIAGAIAVANAGVAYGKPPAKGRGARAA
jgi:hypothetical protein